jgi:SWI/SNF-related matrix-associated actin-dependent regulator of chromatin subfamily D
MNNFLLSTASQQEIQSLDNKIHETVDTINSLKTSREFFLSFAKVPCFLSTIIQASPSLFC